MHHANPTELIHSLKVGMMHESSPGELPIGVAFRHRDYKGHSTLKQYAVCKWLKVRSTVGYGIALTTEYISIPYISMWLSLSCLG